jgi:hypothetical protein
MAWRSNEFDVKGYRTSVEDNLKLSMIQAYKPIIDSSLQYDDQFVSGIFHLFYNAGYLLEVFSLSDNLTEYYRKNDNINGLFFHGNPKL